MNTKPPGTDAALRELHFLAGKIPWNTYRTILGQIRSGKAKEALKGIERLKAKIL